MGNKGAKKPASAQLSKKDLDFLIKQTGLPKETIQSVFAKFEANNPDHVLDKKEFVRLYGSLRSEPPEILDEIAVYVFDAFDKDNNGSINFNSM